MQKRYTIGIPVNEHAVYPLPNNAFLKIEERSQYLYAEVTGPIDSFEITMAYWTLVAQECHARNTKHLLVFEKLGEFSGVRDMVLMVDSIIALGFENIRVAFVDAFIEDLLIAEEGELLAMERGIAGRVFGSLQEAERWLRYR